MASSITSNPSINCDNNVKQEQPLSVAISYETELANDIMSDKEVLDAKTDDGDYLNLEEHTARPVVTNEMLETQSKAGEEAGEQFKDDNAANQAPKRRERPLTYTAPRKKAKAEEDDSFSWQVLLSRVQQRLRRMDSDECFVKAIELAAMARQSVQSRGSAHLLAAFDMLGTANGQAAALSDQQQKINVVADDPIEQWMQKFAELRSYHQRNGHFDVPLNEALGTWVMQQQARVSSLSSTQLHLLSSIGLFPVDFHRNSNLDENKKRPADGSNDSADKQTVYPQLTAKAQPTATVPLATTKSRASSLQKLGKRGHVTQKQIKLHRTTRFRTIEAVPSIKMPSPLPTKADTTNTSLLQIKVPDFAQIVNFPNARYMAKCVMCDEDEYPIPNQNKGVCNNCDSAIWIHVETGLEMKWCKGCKNFRKWMDFGDKVSL
jgi:hypothetical protein